MSFWAMALVWIGFPVTRVCMMRYLFLPSQWALENNNLPTRCTTPKRINFLPSMTLSLFMSGGKGNRNGSYQDDSCLCLETRLACQACFEPPVLSVGVGNTGLRIGCQSKLWRLSYFVTSSYHWLCCNGHSLASAITTQETGVEDRKCGFLWFYSTMSPCMALLAAELWHTLIGICFY